MARYRRAHRSAVLNLTIVGLAAVTATLWIARPELPKPQQAGIHLWPSGAARTRATHGSGSLTGRGGTGSLLPLTQTATPTPTATGTPASTVTPTATPEDAAPTPSATPTGTPAPDGQSSDGGAATPNAAGSTQSAPAPARAFGLSASPRGVPAQVAQTAYLRTDPTVAALIIGALPTGTVVSVVGCANSCSWLLVQLPGGGQAWSEEYFYTLLGNLAGL